MLYKPWFPDFLFLFCVKYKFATRNNNNINIIKQKLRKVYLYILAAIFVLFRRISGNILN
ncbi:hypothetical protein B5724_09075 [Morganella morganii]|nr:hypothetical protein X965_03530 [Morganella sp. EGD-HP17]OFU99114.1 hypothetical protein HMPREF3119_09925 [Morganella sp. HMSC11D09]OVF55619.1 hypothetical protein B5724_09075 [Morganella morganii]